MPSSVWVEELNMGVNPFMEMRLNSHMEQIEARNRQSESQSLTSSYPAFATVEDLKTALRNNIDREAGPPPTRLSCHLYLSSSAVVPLKKASRITSKNAEEYSNGDPNRSPYWSVLGLCAIEDKKERHACQRDAARALLYEIQEVDGFKYSVNNIWTSKEDTGYRFSYTCLDSKENKDRKANGGKRPRFTADGRAIPARANKETYDCKGQLSVKFVGAKQFIEVVYVHCAAHKTVQERAPPPRRKRPPPELQHALADEEAAQPPVEDNFVRNFGLAAASFARAISGSQGASTTPARRSQPGVQASQTPLDGVPSIYESPALDPADEETPVANKRRRRTKNGENKPRGSSKDKPVSLADLLRSSMPKSKTPPPPPAPSPPKKDIFRPHNKVAIPRLHAASHVQPLSLPVPVLPPPPVAYETYPTAPTSTMPPSSTQPSYATPVAQSPANHSVLPDGHVYPAPAPTSLRKSTSAASAMGFAVPHPPQTYSRLAPPSPAAFMALPPHPLLAPTPASGEQDKTREPSPDPWFPKR